MTSVPDMYHRHPTSGFRNFFKLRYAEDLCPQTATRVHSSPSSHLSQDECNPTGSLFIHTPKKKRAKNGARSQTQSWHTASVETETLRGDSSAATCSTRESPKALLL